MSNVTANQAAIIRAQVYSALILEQLHEGLLSEGLARNVGDFGDGDTLNIPVMGETVLRDFVEDTPVSYDAVDTGSITLSITEYVSGASSISRKLKADSYKAAALEAQIPKDHARLIAERYETNTLEQTNKQTLANPNTINSFDHRWVAGSHATAGVITLADFFYAKTSLDKANAPEQGRIAIVDPVVELALNHAAGLQAFINNPQFTGLVETGFGRNHRFIRHIAGFDVYISNRLAQITSESITGGPQGTATAVSGFAAGNVGLSNIFGCFADDMTTPFMSAWRQQPETTGEFNKDFQRDEYVTTARWGCGLQRPDTLITVITANKSFK